MPSLNTPLTEHSLNIALGNLPHFLRPIDHPCGIHQLPSSPPANTELTSVVHKDVNFLESLWNASEQLVNRLAIFHVERQRGDFPTLTRSALLVRNLGQCGYLVYQSLALTSSSLVVRRTNRAGAADEL